MFTVNVSYNKTCDQRTRTVCSLLMSATIKHVIKEHLTKRRSKCPFQHGTVPKKETSGKCSFTIAFPVCCYCTYWPIGCFLLSFRDQVKTLEYIQSNTRPQNIMAFIIMCSCETFQQKKSVLHIHNTQMFHRLLNYKPSIWRDHEWIMGGNNWIHR